ncbi:MAG TPA: hypothetical protein VET86_03620 [Casimicrobiaceae bacterium]|jgi:hypothetical protein|nr:hypothetical protein [Casimicrobiaceae bacterium]
MRSATVFFSKRQSMRALPAPRHADAGARRAGCAARRSFIARDRIARPLTRSSAVRDFRPHRLRTRREALVPRGFVPLRTH